MCGVISSIPDVRLQRIDVAHVVILITSIRTVSALVVENILSMMRHGIITRHAVMKRDMVLKVPSRIMIGMNRLTGSVANHLGEGVVTSFGGDPETAVDPTVVLGPQTKRASPLARKNMIESKVEVDHSHVVHKRV